MNKIERLEDKIRRKKSEIRSLKNKLANTEDEYEAENLAAEILSAELVVVDTRKELDRIMVADSYEDYEDYAASCYV